MFEIKEILRNAINNDCDNLYSFPDSQVRIPLLFGYRLGHLCRLQDQELP